MSFAPRWDIFNFSNLVFKLVRYGVSCVYASVLIRWSTGQALAPIELSQGFYGLWELPCRIPAFWGVCGAKHPPTPQNAAHSTGNPGAGTIGAFSIGHDGSLTSLGATGGLPMVGGYQGIAVY
ncbi:MAG TPA: hypothetical protein VF326_11785 [Anaerolineaceae bacterium]